MDKEWISLIKIAKLQGITIEEIKKFLHIGGNKMIEVYFNPEGYSCKVRAKVTEEQAKALNKLAKRDEFKAYFWTEKILWLNNEDKTDEGLQVVRVNNNHFVIGLEDSTFFRGHGGSEFIYKLNSGEIIKSTNVWHQGHIPEELRHILKDNAIQVFRCPSCRENILEEEGANALSRKDNETEICSDCGTREALEEI